MIAVYKTNKADGSEIQEYLRSAKKRIHSAEILFEAEEYRDAVSRAYYAFFDAASALLLTEGIVAKTHSGLIALFGLHFIKKNKMKSKFATLFKRAKEAREEADYEIFKKFSKETTEDIIKTAKEFIKEVKSLINKEQ